jgi:hypothetical protein
MVNDTKTFLQESRERMIFTRLATDMSAYNSTEYDIKIPTSSQSPVPRFHVGQPIHVTWKAPSHHSRKDWIGIYRLGSCRSKLVTRISSMGKWVPIHSDEYDGEFPVETGREQRVKTEDAGSVVFRGDSLPWAAGEYELRYHHDGKHNVMSNVGQIQIFGEYCNRRKIISADYQSTSLQTILMEPPGRRCSISFVSPLTRTALSSLDRPRSCPTLRPRAIIKTAIQSRRTVPKRNKVISKR